MRNEQYDAMVKDLLKALDQDESEVTKVTVEPHQVTVDCVWTEDRAQDLGIKSEGIVYGKLTFPREGATPKLPSVNADLIENEALRLSGKTEPSELNDADKAKALYNITVNVPVGKDPAAIGREVVQHIKAYEKAAGKGWRG